MRSIFGEPVGRPGRTFVRTVFSIALHTAAIGALWLAPGFGDSELPMVARADIRTLPVCVVPQRPPAGSPARPRPTRRASSPVAPTFPIVVPSSAPAPEDVMAPDSTPTEPTADSSCAGAACAGVGVGPIGVDLGPVEPASAPPRLVRVSEVRPPRKVRDALPTYPDVARAARVQGVVVVECVIDPSGRVTDAKAISGPPLLKQAAVDAVSRWVYTPTLVSGIPVSVLMNVSVDFRLR